MKSIIYLVASFALVSFHTAGTAADNIETLRKKRDELERQLDSLKARIADLEASKSLQDTDGPSKTFYVKEFGIDDVNSAGGVEPFFVFFNPDAKSPIKYIVARISLFNAVGDIVGSSIGGTTTSGIKFTGPLSHADGEKRADWRPVWYNSSGRCIRIESLQVVHMNGRTINFAGKALAQALAPEVENVCRPAARR